MERGTTAKTTGSEPSRVPTLLPLLCLSTHPCHLPDWVHARKSKSSERETSFTFTKNQPISLPRSLSPCKSRLNVPEYPGYRPNKNFPFLFLFPKNLTQMNRVVVFSSPSSFPPSSPYPSISLLDSAYSDTQITASLLSAFHFLACHCTLDELLSFLEFDSLSPFPSAISSSAVTTKISSPSPSSPSSSISLATLSSLVRLDDVEVIWFVFSGGQLSITFSHPTLLFSSSLFSSQSQLFVHIYFSIVLSL